MVSLKLPLWLRFVLLLGVLALASGVSLLAYRYYTRPVTLSVAVGSIDGEAAKAMSAIASQPVSTNDSIDKLKGRRVGVIGGDANKKIVDVLSKEYGLDREQVFKDIALPD